MDRRETVNIKAPFIYPGGKKWLAPHVWAWLGNPGKYIEPFAGSLAVLLGRPGGGRVAWFDEVVNDSYCHISNVWRSARYKPDELWDRLAGLDPVCEVDLHARSTYLGQMEIDAAREMIKDPLWCYPPAAAWWLWCMALHIHPAALRSEWHSKPTIHVQGVFSANWGREMLDLITKRLQRTQILCGDFARCLTPTYLGAGTCGVYLDPPYALGDDRVYKEGSDHGEVWSRCVEWVLANHTQPGLRIVLSGYRGSPGHEELDVALERHDLKGPVGFGTGENSALESCWVSSQCCHRASQGVMF